MKQVYVLLFVCISILCPAQEYNKFNFGFETHTKGVELPDGWFKWGTYSLSGDTLSYSGLKAGKITADSLGSSFGSIAYRIPANYEGSVIQLTGYMKVRDVEDGFAGLLLRIDGEEEPLEFDNMQKQNITGTRDWKQYTITLRYPEGAKNIFVAGILLGKGEAWFDDFALTIDGKPIQSLEEVEKKLSKAQMDKEFDEGSGIEISELSSMALDKLELLGRVWGFLKYHHPEIAKGNYNWDYELFRFLPEYLDSNGDEERDKLLVAWIDALGEVGECTTCKPTDVDAFLKPDLAWIENQVAPLKDKLLYLYNNRAVGKNYYIEMVPNVGNPNFTNEKSYADMAYPDQGFRLLSLFRYWNIIQYFFPYRHLIDKDWNATLREYLPIFLQAKDELAYELAALQIIADVKDTHANLWRGAEKIQEWKGGYFPPVHLRFIENQLVITDFYNVELIEETGLEVGDVITQIDGKTIKELIKEKSSYYPASNIPTRLRDLSADLLRSPSKEAKISYRRKDSTERVKYLQLYPHNQLNSYRLNNKNSEISYKLLPDNIGYITLQNIKEEDVPKIKEEFVNTAGIIIDIRNYPSTFVPFSLGSYFISASTPFVKFTKGNPDNPGEFIFSKNLEIPSEGESYKGKLVVLVNELSQSQAEYTAMAFRAGDNTTIMGSTTAGADGNVSIIFLPGGLRTMISGIGIYYPDGQETQRLGILPDVNVSPTIEGIRMGKDELLEKAIELINTEKK